MDRNADKDCDWVRVYVVALRKESVDRNTSIITTCTASKRSLSARRAWIEIRDADGAYLVDDSRSPQGERG